MRRILPILGLTMAALQMGALPSQAEEAPLPFDEVFAASIPFQVGEPTVGDVSSFEADCVGGGVSTFSYTVSGPATGNYPGTFVEDVTYTFDSSLDSAPAESGYEFAYGRLVSFDATFTVVSGDTTITGEKHLIPESIPTTDASCFESSNVPGYFDNAGSNVNARRSSTLAFTAVIDGPGGRFRSVGQSNMDDVLYYSESPYYPPYNTPYGFFNELFYTDGTVVPIGPGPAAALAIDPPSATNPVGTSHTVTATATDLAGSAVDPTPILFTVRGSITTAGQCTTVNGACQFSYTGPALPGADSITACADNNHNGSCDPGEPTAEATKAWLLPTSTAGQVTGGGQVPSSTDANTKVAFGFTAQSKSGGTPKGNCSVVDQSPARNIIIKCVDVTALVQSGTHATFYGNATVNGTATTYRIDVDDVAEPGKGSDTFQIRTASGYTAGGTLSQGNNQVH
jgi:hypothetical protein